MTMTDGNIRIGSLVTVSGTFLNTKGEIKKFSFVRNLVRDTEQAKEQLMKEVAEKVSGHKARKFKKMLQISVAPHETIRLSQLHYWSTNFGASDDQG